MDDEQRAALLLLNRLDNMGPSRLRWVLEFGSPTDVVAALRRRSPALTGSRQGRGVSAAVVESWRNGSQKYDGDRLLDDHRRAGLSVLAPGDPEWPFVGDPEPPALLFAAGEVRALNQPLKAGVVGTRRCTTVGRRAAHGFGAELTASGVGVVSGLALGIDGAAHLGALSALNVGRAATSAGLPVAVVASGLDRVYPPKHAQLWAQVIAEGVVVSEAPLGVAPARWRFPARNRLIAALSDVLIVVESHESGGALLTVDEAAERGVPVLAVPGSVLSAASSGTNGLLVDGCAPVRSARDVTELLGLSASSAALAASPAQLRLHLGSVGSGSVDGDSVDVGRVAGDPINQGGQTDPFGDLIVAEAMAGPVHVDVLVGVTGRPLLDVLTVIRRLHVEGRVGLDGSWVGPAKPKG